MRLLDDSLIATLEAISASIRKSAGSSQGTGARKGVLKGGNEEFADYRPYQRGDDFRRIDWKPYLRLNELVTKIFARSTSGNIHLLIDSSASMAIPQGKSLFTQQLAAVLGYLALCGSDRLTAWGVGKDSACSIGPIEGKQNIHRLMDFLQNLKFTGKTDIRKSMAETVMETHGKPEIVIISDLFDDLTFFEHLRILTTRRAKISILHVMDRSEYSPLPMGNVRLEDCETGEVIHKWVGEDGVEEYKKLFAARVEEIQSKCNALNIGYFPSKTDENLKDLAVRISGRAK